MNNKEEFRKWISTNLTLKSGAGPAYIASIDWLSDKFYESNIIDKESIFEIEDIKLMDDLYSLVLKIQKDPDSFIYNKDAPSYGKNYYQSASIRKYKEFLLSKDLITSQLNERNKMFYPLNIATFHNCLLKAGLIFSEDIIARFISSLLTKPFVILTGLSGSGKTKLAQAFSSWICEDESQYCIVPVGADWTNREPLLGFPNALDSNSYIMPQKGALKLIIESQKSENKDKPYFLILDEMNLSHVERYFADFLSAMESRSNIELHDGEGNKDEVPSKIKLQSNLFIIGTVNIDETTYMFSPKVLDRANVIEFRVIEEEMRAYLYGNSEVNMEIINGHGAGMAQDFLTMGNGKSTLSDGSTLNETLLTFFNELKKTGSEFGYRSASEILRFAAIVQQLDTSWTIDKITDAAVMQKLLPKVHGSRKKLAPVLEKLGSLCLKTGNLIKDVFDNKVEPNYTDIGKYPMSLEKITRMHHNLMDNGFTSYAEA